MLCIREVAHSFVYKDSATRHLLYVIRQGVYPGPGDDALHRTRFSDGEISIIRLVSQGRSRNEIAQVLHMSEGSVKAQITDILNKTGFDSIMKFSMYAVARGLIVPVQGK